MYGKPANAGATFIATFQKPAHINFYSDSPWTEAVKQLTFAIRENGLILILNSRNRLSGVELGANIRHLSKIYLIFIYDTYFLMDAIDSEFMKLSTQIDYLI